MIIIPYVEHYKSYNERANSNGLQKKNEDWARTNLFSDFPLKRGFQIPLPATRTKRYI